MEKKEEKVKNLIEEFFKKMEIPVVVENMEEKDSIFFVNLKTKETNLLLGPGGKILGEIEHLLNSLLKKRIDQSAKLDLDVLGYKKKKIEYLKELAKNLANEVALTKKEKILPPMSAKERKIIHLEISKRDDVITESIGEEPNRKVVIRPKIISNINNQS
jgi:spoIIIJ-associated protein